MWPFALLKDWEEANRLIGDSGNIDVKNITGNYLAYNVYDYTRIRPGKIMSSRSFGKRKHISVKELISSYYAPSLEKHQLQLRPYLLGWLKREMEERLDSCEYAMWYADKDDSKQNEAIHEDILRYREDAAAAKYILKKIDRSFTISEQNPVAIRDSWKVLLLNDFHLRWLKKFLLCELDHPNRESLVCFDTTMPISNRVDESKCGLAIMEHLLEIIDRSGKPEDE